MKTDVFLLLCCLVAISICNSISIENGHRTSVMCSNMNPEQEALCRHALIADSLLNQIYHAFNDLLKAKSFPMSFQLESQEVTGDCTMNMSRLTFDLRTVVTAVCLLNNATEKTESIAGCCHSDSRVEEEFQHFTNFLLTNVLRFFITDHNIHAVEPICLERVNIIGVLRKISHTLQQTKQLITAIESRQCLLHS